MYRGPHTHKVDMQWTRGFVRARIESDRTSLQVTRTVNRELYVKKTDFRRRPCQAVPPAGTPGGSKKTTPNKILEDLPEIRSWKACCLRDYRDGHPAIIGPQCEFRHRPNGVFTWI